MHISMQDQRKSCDQGSYYILCQSPALAKHAVTSDIKSTLSSVVGLHSSVTKGPNRFSGQHNGPRRVWCLSAWANLSIPWPPQAPTPVHSLGYAHVRACTHTHLHGFKYKYNTTDHRTMKVKFLSWIPLLTHNSSVYKTTIPSQSLKVTLFVNSKKIKVKLQVWSFFNLSTRWGWVVNTTLQLLYTILVQW